MPFLTGNVTFSRFAVRGPKPGMFSDSYLELLRAKALNKGSPLAANGISIGWAAGSHVLDQQFSELKNIFPDHLSFDFWIETNKLPGELFKAYYETDLRALSAGNPTGHPSMRQKREAKESARERLEDEAKDGRFKKRKCIPVLWDAIRNEVLVGTTSEAMLDRFLGLFDKTFGELLGHKPEESSLVLRSAATLATDMKPEARDAELSRFSNGTQEGAECRWAPFSDRPDFLGNEFLLWLWFKGDGESDTIRVNDGTEVTFAFLGGIRLEHPTLGDNDTINSASAVRKPQALQAARSGYLPRKAAITLYRNGDLFSCKLNAESLSVSALKLPKPDDAVTEARARLEDRLGIRQIGGTIGGSK